MVKRVGTDAVVIFPFSQHIVCIYQWVYLFCNLLTIVADVIFKCDIITENPSVDTRPLLDGYTNQRFVSRLRAGRPTSQYTE